MTRGGHSSSQILQRLNRQKALSQKAQTTRLTSEVFAFHVRNKPGGVQEAVKKAMAPIWEKNLLVGRNIFVKVNLISSEFVPGQCTSPLILDEVLKELTKNGYKVTLGDADLAAARQCDKAGYVWGHRRLASKYGARFQNLSKDKLIKVEVNGRIFKTLEIPRVVYQADHIISLPVMKTHCLTEMTCALKHFWGIVPRVRHQYHLVVNEAIADIAQLIQPKLAFSIVDGTIAMEGDGPRTGKPKICNVLMSSNDPVALDAAVAQYMGMDIPIHVKAAADRGVGNLDYRISGDKLKSNPFISPAPKSQPIFRWEMALRKTKLKPLFFDTPLFGLFAFIATKYNTFWYYQLQGKKFSREIAETFYGQELSRFVQF
jgi:uncharacterized protein (DUF362 family)